jgi:outer membrane protein TolC
LQALEGRIQAAAVAIDAAGRDTSWQALQNLAREEQARVADLFVLQTQVRVYLIQLPESAYALPEAVDLAQGARLDLMNQRARVVDAWRRVGVAADALGAGLDLVAGADIGTAPDASNPVQFSRAGSSYRVGVRLDGPLNRMAERNVYRASLIDYQRARRDYMGLEDGIARAVRQTVRRIEADRLNFEITRQSLITAARQVEQAREQLVAPGPAGDSSSTQDVLDALQSLLDTKNALIEIWVSYVTNRLQLLLELEALQLDAKGLPVETEGVAAARRPEEER